MRVFKAKDLVPHALKLGLASASDLFNGGKLIDLHTILEYRCKQLLCREVFKSFALPRVDRIKELYLVLVDFLVVKAKQVCLCLSRILAAQALYLFEMRRGYLLYVLTYLDLGKDISLFILNGAKLINAAENG